MTEAKHDEYSQDFGDFDQNVDESEPNNVQDEPYGQTTLQKELSSRLDNLATFERDGVSVSLLHSLAVPLAKSIPVIEILIFVNDLLAFLIFILGIAKNSDGC